LGYIARDTVFADKKAAAANGKPMRSRRVEKQKRITVIWMKEPQKHGKLEKPVSVLLWISIHYKKSLTDENSQGKTFFPRETHIFCIIFTSKSLVRRLKIINGQSLTFTGLIVEWKYKMSSSQSISK
jgi:hypothetical protein